MNNRAVQARVDDKTRKEAKRVLHGMGLNMSSAVRMFVTSVARNKTLPAGMLRPNRVSRQAIRELESGRGARFESLDDLMKDLDAND